MQTWVNELISISMNLHATITLWAKNEIGDKEVLINIQKVIGKIESLGSTIERNLEEKP